jgi:hypothetical protein
VDVRTAGGLEQRIEFCATHKTAPAMLKALERIGREKCYCEYHYPDDWECSHEIALTTLGLTRRELLAQARGQEPAS